MSACSVPSSFATVDGRLLVNEIAPRPHNSGHFTFDACLTSQFEQQVRRCGLPLGSTAIRWLRTGEPAGRFLAERRARSRGPLRCSMSSCICMANVIRSWAGRWVT